MTAAEFLWWMAAAAMVLPFLDVVQRTVGPKQWVSRATAVRVVLAVLEVGTLLAWFAFARGRWGILDEVDTAVAIAGALLALTGALLAAWAKTRLGRLFSPQLGVQEDHHLVTTGPYAVVRHPIYLGIIDFIVGSALFYNDLALLVVGVLFMAYFAAQIRVEERQFAAHFGEEWRAYARRTPALLPFRWRARHSA
ncbi:MAG TPA: isoprenylcysteine carboxylmethyltransferase family protein [Longimicrobiales bacterium]|nr:isoprenylcysteine carboxylmethyltransferase family protein [Longimicrobiales bacterium]